MFKLFFLKLSACFTGGSRCFCCLAHVIEDFHSLIFSEITPSQFSLTGVYDTVDLVLNSCRGCDVGCYGSLGVHAVILYRGYYLIHQFAGALTVKNGGLWIEDLSGESRITLHGNRTS